MIDMTKAHYLELEERIHSLRTHFALCKGADDKETLDWAKFFLAWSKAACLKCGDWSQVNLRGAENFVKDLERSKGGVLGYGVLEHQMAEAATRLNGEILDSLRKTPARVTVPANL